jgi:hypothetical protein
MERFHSVPGNSRTEHTLASREKRMNLMLPCHMQPSLRDARMQIEKYLVDSDRV